MTDRETFDERMAAARAMFKEIDDAQRIAARTERYSLLACGWFMFLGALGYASYWILRLFGLR